MGGKDCVVRVKLWLVSLVVSEERRNDRYREAKGRKYHNRVTEQLKAGGIFGAFTFLLDRKGTDEPKATSSTFEAVEHKMNVSHQCI